MDQTTIDGTTYETLNVPTNTTCILLIKARGGFLGCGYFDVQAANRSGDAFAIVSGVRSIEQMLTAPVLRMSEKAREAGIKEGMSGKEALSVFDQATS
jgi:uncharacterized protein YunC (DUF1805 family)